MSNDPPVPDPSRPATVSLVRGRLPGLRHPGRAPPAGLTAFLTVVVYEHGPAQRRPDHAMDRADPAAAL
jgi:hypothetical protein